jgi:protein tyrosine phosphatase (PTP) superfamily phosphohydrolase (DUF442 family)
MRCLNEIAPVIGGRWLFAMKITVYLAMPSLALALLGCATGGASLVQKNPPHAPPDAKSPLLVWDVAPNTPPGLPRNFRTTEDPLKSGGEPPPSVTGLAELHAAGSGAFNTEELNLVLARLPGPVTVFDLRQESHLFVNDLPVSWFATNNWANVGRTEAEIFAAEALRLQEAAPGVKIELHDDNSVKSPATALPPIPITVETAATEKNIVETHGATYIRLPVADHVRPGDAEVDHFIEAVRLMPAEGWAYFHCRAGKGRTTTFMALYDMLRNARRVSLEDIAHRQEFLGDDLDVLQPSPVGSWKIPYTEDRINFVRTFYDYARANPGGRPQLWSEWLKAATKP